MLFLKHFDDYAINLFYKKYPPFAHIAYNPDTLFYIWKKNLKYLKLMLNCKNIFQIRKFNKLRLKFLKSYFPEHLLVSVLKKEDKNNFIFLNNFNLKTFTILRNFILDNGFKSYYVSDILSLNNNHLHKRINNYFKIFSYIKNNLYFTKKQNIGLNFCVNFFDNINLENKNIPEDIIGFSLCQIHKFHYYNFYIGININKEELSEDDIKEISSIYLHEQAHSIDMALFCYLKKPAFITNLFSNYKNKKEYVSFYNIYQEIFNSAYNTSDKIKISEAEHFIRLEKINICDSYSEHINIHKMNDSDKIFLIDSLETIFKKNSNISKSIPSLQQFFKEEINFNDFNYYKFFYNKYFFYYIYKKENAFDIFYKNLNTNFIDLYFHHNISHQKYLLETEEKFANTRFYNTGTSYTHFLFEALIKEIFTTDNPYFYL